MPVVYTVRQPQRRKHWSEMSEEELKQFLSEIESGSVENYEICKDTVTFDGIEYVLKTETLKDRVQERLTDFEHKRRLDNMALKVFEFEDSLSIAGCRLDNLELEEKKITAAHNAYKYHTRNFFWFDDAGWHNIRAILINRVEQATNNRLVVTWNDDEFNPEYKIQDRKTYLKREYNIDWQPPGKDEK